MSEKNGLVKNASFLMMATLISRVIGLLYRSPLGVVLGNGRTWILWICE